MTGRRRLRVDGVVQGVGFRPFVYNLARSEALAGFVTNTSDGVIIEVEGPDATLDRFAERLQAEAPALAAILAVNADALPPAGDAEFVIRPSENTPGTRTLVPADVATCSDCLAEVRDPGDRRYGYAFANCTNCGPRWTIVDRIPYDRPYTSMAPFTMCPACQTEYDDPGDRRFHAQPNACPGCGPRVWLEDGDRRTEASGAVAAAASLLDDGRIVAVKGLGGFHLAVRADQGEAVARLRRRKHREAKPLALMVADLAAARRLCEVSPAEAELLGSAAAPIVLLTAGDGAGAHVAGEVAPGHRRLGLMLPATPLHHLLMDALATRGITAAVMTSGNASSEPICLDNDAARRRLRGIADAWLLHDRGILRRADDSVVQIVAGRPLLHRRGRGHAPLPVLVDAAPEACVLATGGDLKNTVALLKDSRVFLSPHVGDLENLPTHGFFETSLETLQQLLECRPAVLAHDLHPGYLGTRWATLQRRDGRRTVAVQHHHAHLAAVQAEHGLPTPAVGLILDGTGYGPDGTIWGGEVLAGDAGSYRRLGHLDCVPLPGGDAAIREPWRTTVSHLRHAFGDDPSAWPALPWLAERPVAPVLDLLRSATASPQTSSCGRLFDAVAALTGRWPAIDYEAQAAMEFMALADPTRAHAAPLWPDIGTWTPTPDEPLVIPVRGLVSSAARDMAAGADPADLSARFHRNLVHLLVTAGVAACRRTGLSDVVLGGGVFQNELVLSLLVEELEAAGLRAVWSQSVPAGDGGLALGQAVIAAQASADEAS